MRVIILATAALVGIVVGSLWRVEPAHLVGACAAGALGACLGWPQPRWPMLALVACASSLGAMRAALVPTPHSSGVLEPYLGNRVRLRAQVAELPRLVSGGVYSRLVLNVAAVGPPGQEPTALNAPLQVSTSLGPPGQEATPLNASLQAHAPPQFAPAQVVVLADPAAPIAGLAQAEYATLEGRLMAAADAPGPPVIFAPRLVDHPSAANPGESPAASPIEPAYADAAPRERAHDDGPRDGSATPGEETPGQGAYAHLMRRLASLRQAAATNIQRYLPEPQASLAVGILLGGAGRLSPEFKLDLQRSGLTHVLAIDGYKQVLVAGLASALVGRLFGVRVALLTTLALISGYTLLTGAHPSAVRAALMLALASVATLSGRVADPLTSLLLVVLGLAAVEPALLFDVGLQLSVSATLGIILLWPRLRRRLQRLPRWVAEPLGLSAAVTLATLPVTLSSFQFVSFVSPVAHIAAVPLLPLVLVSAALLAAIAAVPPPGDLVARAMSLAPPMTSLVAQITQLPPLGAVCAWLASPLPLAAAVISRVAPQGELMPLSLVDAWLKSLAPLSGAANFQGKLPSPVVLAAWLGWLPTTLLAWIIHAFGSMPAAGVSTGRLPTSAAVVLAVALLGFGVWQLPELAALRLGLRRWGSDHPKLLAPCASAAACLGATALLSLIRPDGLLHVQPLRVSRGQAVFIRGPTGYSALVVSGQPSPTLLASQVAQNLAVWEHQLNLVVALDSNAQNALGQTLGRYHADQLLVQPNGDAPHRLEVGRGTAIDVWSVRGQLRVALDDPKSVPTTFAARPGSAD